MNKDFLHISDFSSDELLDLMKLAKDLKQKFRNREDYKVFHNKTLAMIFAKPVSYTHLTLPTILIV